MSIKRYNLNKDFAVDCETIVENDTKIYNVYVVLTSVPFLNMVESTVNITDSSEANRVFKLFVEKYRIPLEF